MCGIAGIFNFTQASDPLWIKAMADRLRHRGPDDEGYIAVNTSSGTLEILSGSDSRIKALPVDKSRPANLYLAHRRLSILDLSPLAHQPMANARGDIWVTYNGEIYNYLQLRDELKSLGRAFKTSSDTEVLLAAYEEWGVKCLDRFDGMWAFVIYDARKNILFGSRDRFGVKPFYYINQKGRFVFASEPKAILDLPFYDKKINKKAAFDYLASGLEESGDESIFAGIFELKPSTAFEVNLKDGEFRKWQYYSLALADKWEAFDEARSAEYARNVKELVFKAVKARLRSDVPVGSCLSGGLDSSTIVCVVNKILEGEKVAQVGDRQKVFTASYDLKEIDESRWAELVATRTKTEWLRTFPKAGELMSDLEDLIETQDFPFGSTSIYAQYRVMRLAKERGIKVLLDGQGGDELFSGYTSYYAPFFSEMLMNFKAGGLLNEFRRIGNSPLTGTAAVKSLGKFLIAGNLPTGLMGAAYRFKAKENRLLNRDFWEENKERLNAVKDRKASSLNRYLYQAITGAGLKTLLRYEDRNSMRFSIESRTPFADDRALIEYVFGIPSAYKIHNGWSKFMLRESMRGVIPDEIASRKDKIGFATPEYHWLNESKTALKANISGTDDFLDAAGIIKDWDGIMAGQPKTGITGIWRIINFSIWKKKFGL